MHIGDVLLYIALITGSIPLLMYLDERTIGSLAAVRPYCNWFWRISAGFLTAAVMLMWYYFLASDFSINYVHLYSSIDLPRIYKISALWTGEEGSILFLSWVLLLVALYFNERIKLDPERYIILIMALLLLILTILLNPFALTLEAYPEMGSVPEDGFGLNPLLINIWMVLHPPAIFIGYALMVGVFAAAMVKRDGWESLSRSFARLAWVILGAGIVSGCIWSYEVWESYWIWDPAFTSSLMVWLLFTGYLHAAARHRREEDYQQLAPALGIMSFVTALYSTYIIRSGTIQSVHSFANSDKNILLLYTVLMLFILCAVFIFARMIREKSIAKKKQKNCLLSDVNLFQLTTLLFILLSIVLFTGLSYTLIMDLFGRGIAVSVALFNDWSYPLTLLLLLLMGVCMFDVRQRRYVLVLALILAVLFAAGQITEDIYDDISAAVLGFTFVSGLYRLGKEVTSGSRLSGRLLRAGPYIVHLGISIMLIGVLLSTNFTAETIYFRSFGEKKAVGEYQIELIDLAFPVKHDHNIAEISKIGIYNIYSKKGEVIATGEASFVEKGEEYITEPFIYRGLLSDVRITYQGVGTTTPILISFVNIKIIPGMSLIWAGSLLVLLGILPSLWLHVKIHVKK